MVVKTMTASLALMIYLFAFILTCVLVVTFITHPPTRPPIHPPIHPSTHPSTTLYVRDASSRPLLTIRVLHVSFKDMRKSSFYAGHSYVRAAFPRGSTWSSFDYLIFEQYKITPSSHDRGENVGKEVNDRKTFQKRTISIVNEFL